MCFTCKLLISAISLTGAISSAAAQEKGKVVDLGVAVRCMTYDNTEGTVGPSPQGGHPIFYTSYYTTTGAELLAYDHRSKKVFRYDLPGTRGGYGLTTGLDGKIYVGTVQGNNGGHLMQFDPKTETLRDLGNAGMPTTYVWSCATCPDGKIFGAGYPGWAPLIYDPRTNKLTSPKDVDVTLRAGASSYLRSVAADAKGRAWFGVGTKAMLIVYDPADGSHRDVLPEKYAPQSTVIRLLSAGNCMYATILFGGQVLVFDAQTCEFLREIPVPSGEEGLYAAVSDSKGNVYCSTTPNGHLYIIRPGSSQAEKLVPFLGNAKALLEDRYLHTVFDNDHCIFDLETRQVLDRHKWIEPKAAMGIMSTLTCGPKGKIYGSTYINQHLFCYDPATGKLEDGGRIIRSCGQCDSMCCSRDGKRLWMGHYIKASLAVYDPSKPHKLGMEPDCNPRDFGRIGKGQYRTRAIVEGPLGKIYVGSVPSYNSAPTGALTIFDPKTLEKKVMSDFVPGGAVDCLTASDRFVYGSGGGKLFMLDPNTQQKVNELALGCTAMRVLSDGTLVVSTSNDLQGLDRETLEKRWSIPFSQVDGLKSFCRLVAGLGGELYGMSNLGIFQIDVAAGKLAQLTNFSSDNLVLDNDGRFYFSRGTNLYMYDPRGQ